MLVMVNLFDRCEITNFTYHKDMKDDSKCIKWGDLDTVTF